MQRVTTVRDLTPAEVAALHALNSGSAAAQATAAADARASGAGHVQPITVAVHGAAGKRLFAGSSVNVLVPLEAEFLSATTETPSQLVCRLLRSHVARAERGRVHADYTDWDDIRNVDDGEPEPTAGPAVAELTADAFVFGRQEAAKKPRLVAASGRRRRK